jgi:hypothetical protein
MIGTNERRPAGFVSTQPGHNFGAAGFTGLRESPGCGKPTFVIFGVAYAVSELAQYLIVSTCRKFCGDGVETVRR